MVVAPPLGERMTVRAVVAAVLLWAASGSAAGTTRALVVSGLGGTDAYEVRFQQQAGWIADALREVGGDVTLLLGPMGRGEAIAQALTSLAERSGQGDSFVLVLIGHGSFDDRTYRFNVPGPDVTGEILAQWLDAMAVEREVVVVASSASGALQSTLQARRRTLVTATRSGTERNASVFAGFFAAALDDRQADVDKDGYLSVAEAFRFAEAGVVSHFKDNDEMAAEHPLLQGAAGAEVVLARLTTTPSALRPQASPRLAELERAIAALRADRDNRDGDAYYAELQRLLLELAVARRQADRTAAPLETTP